MDLGQGAPGAAHGVETLALELGCDRFQGLIDTGLDAVGVEPLAVGQGERPQRQGQTVLDAVSVQPGQLKTGAAHVGRDAVSQGSAGQYAHGRIFGLFLTRQDADLEAGLSGDPFTELRPVQGFAHGGGGGDQGRVRPHAFQNGGETAQRRHRHDHALGRQLAGRRQVPAQAGQNLLIINGPDRAAFQPVQDQANRV